MEALFDFGTALSSFLGALVAFYSKPLGIQLGRLILCYKAYGVYLQVRWMIFKKGYAEIEPPITRTSDIEAMVISWLLNDGFDYTNHNYSTGAGRVYIKVFMKYWEK